VDHDTFLWRISLRGVSRPVYLVAPDIQTAARDATAHPLVAASDFLSALRLDAWDHLAAITRAPWPTPAPEPQPMPIDP